MANESCSRCAALEAENALLRARIEMQEREIRQLKIYIAWLLKIIAAIRRYCEGVISRCQLVLQSNGHKPGKYHYARGANATAKTVHSLAQN